VQLQNFIGDSWEAPAQQLSAELCDASTGIKLGMQMESSSDQIDRAIAIAYKVRRDNSWTNMPSGQRAALMLKAAEELTKHGQEIALADCQSTGVIQSLTEKFALICAGAFKAAADLITNPPSIEQFEGPYGELLIERLPLGVAAIIAPWNAPAGITCHKLASALAAGCPAIIKPSEWAPLSGQIIMASLAAAGFPAGVCQLLHGTSQTGSELITDMRVAAVSFTGGLAGGRAVATACARDIKPAQLELGGNNPMVVLASANIGNVTEAIVMAMTTLNGQWCRALGRLLIHQDIADEVLAKVKEKLAMVKIGNAKTADTQMGPMVHRGHLHQIRTAVEEYVKIGGQLHQVTPLPELDGWFYPPTLITGLDSEQTQEEIFGPVVTVHTFSSDEQALAQANQAPFGLAAYVFGDEDHCWQIAREITTGITKINAVTMLNLNPMAPRPAWKLSGIGDEGTLATFEFFRGTRVIGVAGKNQLQGK
jgi:acyl-CoA reductase-like NAD-dependent aldehyde dehydrogenase